MTIYLSFCVGSSPGGTGGTRPPYHPPYPSPGRAGMGQSNPPYPVTNQASYPTNTQSSYPGATGSPSATQANMVTSGTTTTSHNNLGEDDIKASLRSAVEDKIRRSTRALFEQAQVILRIVTCILLCITCTCR